MSLRPGCVGRHGEGDGVVGVSLGHGAGGQHDDLVHVSRAARVGLGAAHDDTVGAALDDAQVVVGMGLGAGSAGAVALHVGLGDGHGQVVVAAVPVKLVDAGAVVCLAGLIDGAGDAHEAEEGIAADLLYEGHERLAASGGCLDKL